MTQEQNSNSTTFTIIVDEDVAVFLDQQRISDPNAYITRLLQQEKSRQEKRGDEPDEKSMTEILESTPDASGTGNAHFGKA